jgi:hypothetical protein
MGISVWGEEAEAITWPVSAASRVALTEELPKSRPRRNIVGWGKVKHTFRLGQQCNNAIYSHKNAINLRFRRSKILE